MLLLLFSSSFVVVVVFCFFTVIFVVVLLLRYCSSSSPLSSSSFFFVVVFLCLVCCVRLLLSFSSLFSFLFGVVDLRACFFVVVVALVLLRIVFLDLLRRLHHSSVRRPLFLFILMFSLSMGEWGKYSYVQFVDGEMWEVQLC